MQPLWNENSEPLQFFSQLKEARRAYHKLDPRQRRVWWDGLYMVQGDVGGLAGCSPSISSDPAFLMSPLMFAGWGQRGFELIRDGAGLIRSADDNCVVLVEGLSNMWTEIWGLAEEWVGGNQAVVHLDGGPFWDRTPTRHFVSQIDFVDYMLYRTQWKY